MPIKIPQGSSRTRSYTESVQQIKPETQFGNDVQKDTKQINVPDTSGYVYQQNVAWANAAESVGSTMADYAVDLKKRETLMRNAYEETERDNGMKQLEIDDGYIVQEIEAEILNGKINPLDAPAEQRKRLSERATQLYEGTVWTTQYGNDFKTQSGLYVDASNLKQRENALKYVSNSIKGNLDAQIDLAIQEGGKDPVALVMGIQKVTATVNDPRFAATHDAGEKETILLTAIRDMQDRVIDNLMFDNPKEALRLLSDKELLPFQLMDEKERVADMLRAEKRIIELDERKEDQEEKVKDQMQEDTFTNLLERLNDGEDISVSRQQASKYKLLSKEDNKALIKLEKANKEAIEDDEQEENAAILESNIYAGQAGKKHITKSFLADDITYQQFTHLMSVSKTAKTSGGVQTTQTYKMNRQFLKKWLVPNSMFGTASAVKGERIRAEALLEYDRRTIVGGEDPRATADDVKKRYAVDALNDPMTDTEINNNRSVRAKYKTIDEWMNVFNYTVKKYNGAENIPPYIMDELTHEKDLLEQGVIDPQ